MADRGVKLDGDWVNVDPHTRGIVRITIHGSVVHPYGACRPACDWGQTPTQSFASRVDAHDRFALLSSQHTGFSEVLMTSSIESDGRLRVQCFVHFKDQSQREDYSSVDYFRPNDDPSPPTPRKPAPSLPPGSAADAPRP